ncbi:MAG: Maf family protein [Candidatus Omnitrophota bacterium]
MTRIILASASPQRRKLLKMAGLKFVVKPSGSQEIQKIETTCQALVRENALLKARDVAGKVKKGLVIGADTVVYGGGKTLIGKPKSLADACRILREMFTKPHWVYTGVAIIDAESGKTLVDYERTKVFMYPLTRKEMDRYHDHMSPLDKAGGFDIEGRGGTFIHRIEGCYTNVIGLPMVKIRMMLKKFGVEF